jgi:REP element-mobilizing transposase RayT
VGARTKQLQQQLFDAVGRPAVVDGKIVRRRQPPARKRRRTPGVKLGRPPKGPRAGAPHKRRPELKRRFPVHVVLRVVEAIGSMRKWHMYKALREATISVAKRELNAASEGAFRIVHISVQRNHVHLLVEADHKVALSRGMQSFQISAAKHLNRAVSLERVRVARRRGGAAGRAYVHAMAQRRRGAVFPDRFHQEIIKTPKQARHTLAYVLNNWRKHREDATGRAATWKVDPFSTGVMFDGWKEREHADAFMRYRDEYDPLVVYLPKTWLLYEGWRKHGLIGFDFVPSAKEMARVFERVA